MSTCGADMHAQDYFTDPIMDEQHESIRKLQGALKKLDNMIGSATGGERVFIEYLYDQKLLNGEIV